MKPFFKKNFFTVLWALLILVLLFYPPAKIFLLKAVIHTGLFNASTKKETSTAKDTTTNFSFRDENGNTINIADLKGRVIFINFWATWCPPCIAEMGSVNAMHNKLKDDPRFVFLLADADNDFSKSVAFMKKNNYDLPVCALSSSIPSNFYSGTLPTTIIIDANGNIAQRHEGIANYDTDAMVGFLQSLAR